MIASYSARVYILNDGYIFRNFCVTRYILKARIYIYTRRRNIIRVIGIHDTVDSSAKCCTVTLCKVRHNICSTSSKFSYGLKHICPRRRVLCNIMCKDVRYARGVLFGKPKSDRIAFGIFQIWPPYESCWKRAMGGATRRAPVVACRSTRARRENSSTPAATNVATDACSGTKDVRCAPPPWRLPITWRQVVVVSWRKVRERTDSSGLLGLLFSNVYKLWINEITLARAPDRALTVFDRLTNVHRV